MCSSYLPPSPLTFFVKKVSKKTFHTLSAEIGQYYKLITFIPTLPQRDYSALDLEHQFLMYKE